MKLYIIVGSLVLLLGTVGFFKVKMHLMKKEHEKEKEKLEMEKQMLIEATEKYADNINSYVSKLEELRRIHEKDAEILKIDDDAARINALYHRVRELAKQAESDRNKT